MDNDKDNNGGDDYGNEDYANNDEEGNIAPDNNENGGEADQYFDDAGDIGYLPADHVTAQHL